MASADQFPALCMLYASFVLKGAFGLDAVPKLLREKVRKIVEDQTQENN